MRLLHQASAERFPNRRVPMLENVRLAGTDEVMNRLTSQELEINELEQLAE